MVYPKLVRNAKTPVQVVITAAEPNEFNERNVLLNKWFLCNYQDGASVKYTADKQSLITVGTVYIDGDILPDEHDISSGYVTVFGEKRIIAKGSKARNFDGSVNYTRLDVI